MGGGLERLVRKEGNRSNHCVLCWIAIVPELRYYATVQMNIGMSAASPRNGGHLLDMATEDALGGFSFRGVRPVLAVAIQERTHSGVLQGPLRLGAGATQIAWNMLKDFSN